MDHEAVAVPDRIRRLDDLAHDLSWSWHPTAREVFRRLDSQLWRATGHNPVQMLQMLTPEHFQRAAADSSFLSMYDEAAGRADRADFLRA
jgi:starch phosphorylase